MRFSPIPDICVPDLFSVTPKLLSARGITLLLMDLDNTFATYAEHSPSEQAISWAEACRDAGIDLFILSNNRCPKRVRAFADACKIPFIHCANKPNPLSLQKAMRQMDREPGETALVGDQVFTDGLAANRAGVLSIVVRPLQMKNVFFSLRYFIEQPFRRLSKEKHT